MVQYKYTQKERDNWGLIPTEITTNYLIKYSGFEKFDNGAMLLLNGRFDHKME